MKKLDGRKLDSKTMEELRIRAVQCVQDGESPEIVIKALGFSRACIYNWLARYRAGGWHALKTGKRSGRPKKLSGSQIAWIYRTLRDKDPQQLKFPFALWTREMVASIIKKQFGIKLSNCNSERIPRSLLGMRANQKSIEFLTVEDSLQLVAGSLNAYLKNKLLNLRFIKSSFKTSNHVGEQVEDTQNRWREEVKKRSIHGCM